jgi:hypothetical protein
VVLAVPAFQVVPAAPVFQVVLAEAWAGARDEALALADAVPAEFRSPRVAGVSRLGPIVTES